PDWAQLINNPGADDGPADVDSGHGTHVAGSVLGNGSSSAGLSGLTGPIRGLAFKARLVFQAVEQEMLWKKPEFAKKFGGRFVLSGLPLDLADLFAATRGLTTRSASSWTSSSSITPITAFSSPRATTARTGTATARSTR